MENLEKQNLEEQPYGLLSVEKKEQKKRDTAHKVALDHGPEGSEIYQRKYEESLGNMGLW